MLRINLPWLVIEPNKPKKDKQRTMQRIKTLLKYENLYPIIPEFFHPYLDHIAELDFSQRPDYELLRNCLLAGIALEATGEISPKTMHELEDFRIVPSSFMKALDSMSFQSKMIMLNGNS